MSTVQERAKAMLGNREIKARPGRPGCVLIQGEPQHRRGQQPYEPWWEVDMRRERWECNCPAFGFGTGGYKHRAYTHLDTPLEQVAEEPRPGGTCKHVELIRAALPVAQALVDAGVVRAA